MGGTALLSFYPPERHQLKAPLARDLVAPYPAMPSAMPCTTDCIARDLREANVYLSKTMDRLANKEDPPDPETIRWIIFSARRLLSRHAPMPLPDPLEMTVICRNASESGATGSGASSSLARRSRPHYQKDLTKCYELCDIIRDRLKDTAEPPRPERLDDTISCIQMLLSRAAESGASSSSARRSRPY